MSSPAALPSIPNLTEGEWGLVLGVAGIVTGVLIAMWQIWQGRRDRHRLERLLVQQETSITQQVGEFVVAALGHPREEEPAEATAGGSRASMGREARKPKVREVLIAKPPEDHRFAATVVSHEDIDGDGTDELLVQYPAAAHSTMLTVLGWTEGFQFGVLGTLTSNTQSGFAVGDLDGDGRIEIAAIDVREDYGPGYAGGPRDEVLYRWERGKLREVNRREIARPTEDWSRSMLWFSRPLGQL